MNIKIIPALGIASLLLISACSNAVDTPAGNSAANIVNKANTAVVVNTSSVAGTAETSAPAASNTANTATNKANVNKTSTAATPADESEAEKIRGHLHLGKSGSYILYVGMESGDYAAYCFANDSEAGRAILAACKDGDQCEFVGEIGEDNGCKAPGLEANLSARGKILKVKSVKTLGRQK